MTMVNCYETGAEQKHSNVPSYITLTGPALIPNMISINKTKHSWEEYQKIRRQDCISHEQLPARRKTQVKHNQSGMKAETKEGEG